MHVLVGAVCMCWWVLYACVGGCCMHVLVGAVCMCWWANWSQLPNELNSWSSVAQRALTCFEEN